MKKSLIILIILLGLILIGAGYYFAAPYLLQPSSSRPELHSQADLAMTPPTFTQIPLDFDHSYSSDDYAFAGSALIDIDNDGIDEVFIGGGPGQTDGLFQFQTDRFVNIAVQAGLNQPSSAGGALSIDFDNDGDIDLLVARLDGIYLYTNQNARFTEEKLAIEFESEAAPLSLAATDLNKDGLVDLYISTFKSPKVFKLTTFNEPANRSHNIMLLNQGNNTFIDITERSGLTYNQNTFQASFVDLNNDTWPELVIAPNTDSVVIYENLKNNTFAIKEPLTELGFWMGLATGDTDNDGDQDLFFTNIGNTIPVSAARGDLRPDQVLDGEWALLRNDGNFQFTPITEQAELTNYEFAWGALFEDLNLDGLLDLLVVENYIKWPAHRLNKLDGRVLLQSATQTFTPITQMANLENPNFGTSPLLSDFNQDGYPDVIFVNFNGPSQAHLNDGGSSNFLKIRLPDTARYLGTRVDVIKHDGTILSKQVIGGIGLLTDVSSELIFGLGADQSVDEVLVTPVTGRVQRFNNIPAGETLDIE